jgi:predicted transcriptional regulator of viral defense system
MVSVPAKAVKCGLKIAQNHEMSVASAMLGVVVRPNLPDTWRLAGIRTTSELLAAGNTAKQIETEVRRGKLVRVRRGVYARADMVAQLAARRDGLHLLQTAAALATTGPAVASHCSAAIIHGLDILGKPPRDVTLTRAPGRNRSGQPGTRLHWAQLPTEHVTVHHGMRVTTVARTVIDMARTVEFRAGVVTADSALHQKLVTKAELDAELASARRRRGIQRATEVIAFADALAESVLESIARVMFRDCGLPPPELQVWVGGAEVVGRVDFLWRQFRTVAEVDGLMKYVDPARAILQLERDKRLRDAGYEVVHLGWHEITENPAYAAAAIRSAFRRSHPAA